MSDAFTYTWHELTRGRRLAARSVIQAILLAIVVGVGPDLVLLLIGHNCNAPGYQLLFMAVAVPVILVISVLSYGNKPVTDVTTSSLIIANSLIRVTRYVISETGRRYYATWDALEVRGYKLDELHRVIQIDATWNVSAFRMKGKNPGPFVDSEIRSYTQTFQLKPESYYTAVDYLKTRCTDMISDMSPDEYEKAETFIHKHYEI